MFCVDQTNLAHFTRVSYLHIYAYIYIIAGDAKLADEQRHRLDFTISLITAKELGFVPDQQGCISESKD